MLQKISQWLSLLFLITIIVGCAGSTENTTIPLTVVVPSKQASMTMRLTSTLIAATEIPTAIPTLSVNDALNRLFGLLANNGGCRLPCLWGITPGKTTSQNAQVIMAPLTSIRSNYSIESSFNPEKGFVDPVYTEGDLIFSIGAGYRSDNLIINHIHFYALEEKSIIAPNGSQELADIFDSKTFGKRIEYYSLTHVLSELGIPASVMIITSGPPQSYSGGFEIALLYPDQGIWVNYTTQMYVAGNTVKGCPANAHIEIELYPPGNADSFFALLDKTDWAVRKSSYKPLEEVTSMSVQQFYQTFSQPTDKCIETPAKLWPTPQPGGG